MQSAALQAGVAVAVGVPIGQGETVAGTSRYDDFPT